ncbi:MULTISPECIES: hypothetical protein [unclassified Cyanobium]|uniref:hypothetical protein n=1 Tax=unclassified Cyanobium TaxID=2627006 RepID=UPI0020CF0E75|nr:MULTISPECIES: hypothetical protein [unclassified Cyanobium]MCP9858410.1 hypothetical protein [Cyanobium sp. Cruz-8H5]MCP9865506.1 hypothetical protein [Cyanobium sp. Cruz-8D1]
MPLPPSRPELSSLLLEAVHRRDATATARLTRQWAHRHGVGSLERFRTDNLIAQQGIGAGDWLRQQLEGAAGAPTAAPAVPGPAAARVEDAFAALEAAFSTAPVFAGVAPDAPALVSQLAPQPAPFPTSLPEASRLSVLPPGTPPAPAPSTLADLRSWLSGDPQHRRAS